MAVVAEQVIGHTTMRIHDDCCKNTSHQEVQAILRRVAQCAQADLSAAANAESNATEQAASGF